MTISFSNHVCQLLLDPNDNDVVSSICGYTYAIDSETGSNTTEKFEINLPTANPTNPNYITYASLTEKNVLDWIDSFLTTKTKIQQNLTNKIAELNGGPEKAATTAAAIDLPWT